MASGRWDRGVCPDPDRAEEGERGVRGGNGDRARVRCPQGVIGQGREWAGLAGHWLGRGPTSLGGFLFISVLFSLLSFLFAFISLILYSFTKIKPTPKMELQFQLLS